MFIESLLNQAAKSFGCDVIAPLNDFDGARYMGTWYNQQDSPQVWETDGATCVQAIYSNLTKMGHFDVYNRGEDADFNEITPATADGYCPDQSGKCTISFSPDFTPFFSNY